MKRLAVFLPVVLCVSACLTAGPDYTPPEVAAPDSFEGARSALFDGDAPGDSFWRHFDDAALTALVERGLQTNTDIRIAVARFEESRALSGLSFYSLFPTVTAAASSERSRQSGEDPFTFEGLGVSEVHQLQFDSVWEIDLFGSLKRQNQRIMRRVEADQAVLRDVQRSIVGDIAQSYFALRGARNQYETQRRSALAQAETVDILQKSLDAGRGTAFDVARARALQHSLEAALPEIEAQMATARQRLAVLTASSAAGVDDVLSLSTRDIELAFPDSVSLGNPEQWLQRRPDIRAAERQLAAATASVGVEAAEFYPKLELIGSFGYSGTDVGDIGDRAARRWTFGPSLQWRFLDFGRVRQYVLAAEAAERQAMANFEGVVLRALEDIENALTTYRTTTATVSALRDALNESIMATRLAALRFDNGVSNYLEVLDARRTQLDVENQYARALTSRSTALVAVYKALAVN